LIGEVTAVNHVKTYTVAFYDQREQRTRIAATEILRQVFERYEIASVVDVGCGTGTFLRAAAGLGAERLLGIEGPWLEDQYLNNPPIRIVRRNLEEPLRLLESFDLAISLEVAEHLSPGRAASFVADLCQIADIILFSAAIPGQGGVDHQNEQWPGYWYRLFHDKGYEALDLIRPAIWYDTSIPVWYRQNTLLYVNVERYPISDLAVGRSMPTLDLVHPRVYLDTVSPPGLTECLRLLFRRTFQKACGRRGMEMFASPDDPRN
jgi:SAM-dependent methyltransferase